MSIPESDRVTRAFAKLDAMVVIDVINNDITATATHVLAAPDQLERADVPLVGDNLQIAYASQFTGAVVACAPGRRPVWWMVAELARRLGLASTLPEGHDSDSATDELLLDESLRRGGLPLDELAAHGTAVIIDEPQFGWVHELVLPEGRWRIAPPQLVDQLRELTAEPAAGLLLIPRRLPKVMNSQLHGITSSDSEGIRLNPADAAERGLSDGVAVIVRTAHGEVATIAHIDETMGRGATAMTHGWMSPNASLLMSTTEDVDPLTGMVRLSGVPVSVHAASVAV